MKLASEDQVSGNHYKHYPIQPAEFIQKNGLNWCEGNAIKYLVRHRDKKGAEDLRKAKHYIDLLLEWEYGTPLSPQGEGSDALVKDATAESLCLTCGRDPGCIGDYPRTKDGGCEGYVEEDCGQVGESCTTAWCSHFSTLFMRNCQAYDSKAIVGCEHYHTRTKQDTPTASRADSCPKCSHVADQCAKYRQPDLPCGDFSAKDAPTDAERPAPHTDPAVNCKDCGNSGCSSRGWCITLDLGCERFIQEAAK